MSTPDPSLFLGSCEVIDHSSPEVSGLAQKLAGDSISETVQSCFQFVRDEIKHSSDYQMNPVTCSASEVLEHGTGYCYAKSHLLCALLRANKISAGLCYQRLSVDGLGAPFCLHGLNAVYLPEQGWYRIDARGNREDINAQCTPPTEQLAFKATLPGEYDLPGVYEVPLAVVRAALAKFNSWDDLGRNLPDLAHPS